MNRVKKLLSQSPNKKVAVLKRLVVDIIGPDVLHENVHRKSPSTSLSKEHRSCIQEFYCRDDVSCQAPGIKDVVTVRKKDKTKKKLQKMHTVITIGEAYEEFKKMSP